MYRRLVLLAGAAAGSVVLAVSATAKITEASPGTPAAAPFAQAWAQVPRTTAGRRAANVVVFGAEGDAPGFNTSLTADSTLWAEWMGAEETSYGPFIQDNKGVWISTGITTSASANAKGVSYTISPNAYWYWGGKKVPVTYLDFVYTLRQIDNPANDIASRTGYGNLDPNTFTHRGTKQVTFFWKTTNCTSDFPCGPFANWQSLFSSLYPSAALKGLDFDKIWTNCICGSDGKPVSDGPYYMSNYTTGQGSVLRANPYWIGKKPAIKEVDFKLIPGWNSQVEAMRDGVIDAIASGFSLILAPLESTPGITFDEIPGYYFEHLVFREGNRKAADGVNAGATNKLLLNPWFREAIALSIDRQSIINTVIGPLAGGIKPLNNAIYFQTQAAYKPDFAKWNFDPQKALALMARHCTGGPTSVHPGNTKVWQCSGLPAVINWTWATEDTNRATSEAVAKADLNSVGIRVNEHPLPGDVIYGSTGIPSGNYDVAEFAWAGSGDPGDYYDIWRCQGTQNWTGYCSHKVDSLLRAGNTELDPAKRAVDFQQADAIMANTVPAFPLYAWPVLLVHKSSLLGMVDNPGNFGVFWNIQDWHWK